MGSVGTKQESLVFSPSRTDEISTKLSSASDYKISATTITLKDENGKTMWMVRGSQASKLTGSRLFSVNSDFVKLSEGVKLTQLRDYGIKPDNIFISDNKFYILNNTRTDTFLNNQSSKDVLKSDIEKSKRKKAFLSTFERNGGYVVNYGS